MYFKLYTQKLLNIFEPFAKKNNSMSDVNFLFEISPIQKRTILKIIWSAKNIYAPTYNIRIFKGYLIEN